MILGTSVTLPDSRELAVKKAFRQAGFTAREESDMRGWLWLHFVSDVGMHVRVPRAVLRDALREARRLGIPTPSKQPTHNPRAVPCRVTDPR